MRTFTIEIPLPDVEWGPWIRGGLIFLGCLGYAFFAGLTFDQLSKWCKSEVDPTPPDEFLLGMLASIWPIVWICWFLNLAWKIIFAPVIGLALWISGWRKP